MIGASRYFFMRSIVLLLTLAAGMSETASQPQGRVRSWGDEHHYGQQGLGRPLQNI